MIEDAIQTLLTTETGSPLAYPLASGTQVQAGRAREGWQAPYTIYFLVAPEPRHAHDGPLELRKDTIQLSHFGTSYGQARSEAGAARTLLDGYQGTVSGVKISSCVLTDGRIIYEPDTRLWHASQDFDVQYRETE